MSPDPLPSLQKLRLAGEILLSYAQVRWRLRRDGLPRVVEQLRRPPRRGVAGCPARPLPDGDADGARLGRIVERTLSPLPANTLCLMQSLVLLRLLARRRTDSTLVIAVLPGGQELSAHAWIELDGRPLLSSAGRGYGRLLTL